MPQNRVYTYEAMFLISQAVAADLGAAVEHINELLTRASAELLAMRKWDERRLAYEINKQKRGVYILTYFRAPAQSIAQLERDVNLSEQIMRILILRADHLTEEEMVATDGRDDLQTEARLRGSRPEPETTRPEAATIGAPADQAEESEAAPDEDPD